MNKSNLEEYISSVLRYSDIHNKEIFMHLIKVTLIRNNNRPMKRYVIKNKLSIILDTKFSDKMNRMLQNVLDEGLKSGKFVYNSKDDTYNMSDDEYIGEKNYMDKFLLLQDKFKDDFQAHLAKNSHYLNFEKFEAITSSVIDFIYDYLYSNGIYIFQKIRNNEDNAFLDHEIKNIIYRTYKSFNFNINELSELEKIINEFLLNMNDENIDYIMSVLKQVVFIRLCSSINIKSDSDLLKKRIYYLDTNVLIPLVFNTHPQSNEARYIIRSCYSYGIKLKVTTVTLEEYNRQFEYLKNIDRIFSSASVYNNPRLSRNLSKSNFDNPIYNFYLKNRRTFKDFNDFIERYCDNIFNHLSLFHIEVDKIDTTIFDEYKLSDEYDNLFKDLYSVKQNDKEYVTTNSVNHDLFMINYINEMRRDDDIDEIGFKIWFITLEKRLEKFRLNNIDRYSYPVTMAIDEIYDFLLPFCIDKKEFTRDYVKNLINSNIGLYDYKNENNINLNVLSCIFDSGIDMQALEGLTDNEQKRLIYAIQKNKKVVQVCDEIANKKQSEEENSEEIIDRLKVELKEYINQQINQLRQNSQEMKMIELSKELEKAKSENESLKKYKDMYLELLGEVEKDKNKSIKQLLKEVFLRIANFIRGLRNKIFNSKSTSKNE